MARTATPDAQILALVDAQAASRASFAVQAEAVAVADASSFGGWYESAAITAWAAAMAQHVETFQRATAQSTDAYLARVLSTLTGGRVRPVGRVDVTSLRQGVTHPGAYARAADVYRYQQSEWDRFTRELFAVPNPQPPTIVDPRQAAVQRVKAVADLDVQLADQAQTTEVYAQAAEKGVVTGWRRVIHPERSQGGTCGLCIAASGRLYKPTEPKPIHARCECTTLPVIDGADVGSSLNAADLQRLYKEAGSTSTEDMKRTRYRVDEHGELGPVLTGAGSPRNRQQRTQRKPRAPKSEAQVAADLQKVRDSLAPSLAKARDLAKEDPKRWGQYLHNLEDRIAGLDRQLAA